MLISSYSLHLGGVESSLIALLNQLASNEEIKIDLLLEKNEGDLLKEVPESVNVLETPEILKIFRIDKADVPLVLFKLLYNFKIIVVFWYLYYVFIGTVRRNMEKSRQRFWVKCNKYFNYTNEYEFVISFHYTVTSYFVVDKIESKNKFVWIHGDYRNMDRDKEIDRFYLNKFDKIVTVSQECVNGLRSVFPEYSIKIIEIPNLLPKRKIMELSKEPFEVGKIDGKFNIVSVSRIDKYKGYDIAIPAVSKLLNENLINKWYIVGDGNYKRKLKVLIKKFGLTNYVELTGKLDNPYKVIDTCDIFLHPSRFEGKSVAVEEAKLLKKPIVITNYSTVNDQILHNHNGYIVEMDSESIYRGLKEVMINQPLKHTLLKNLEIEYLEEIDVLSELFK
ncbi:glycosyltransferase [Lysinibacillus antri]|uniref:Glycosyltransferase n=1 Tax=Lysinibacillus antri TaxID=2498145 RepID=A0A3S0P9D5_9BACI|nr:glycosyltransferase [Lysinibacillus antri]RUL55175.1 glycosyltransferase [Lysinibacillus antri]